MKRVCVCCVSSYLKVFNNVDHLSGGIRVCDGALVCHGPQLSKSGDKLLQSSIRNIGPILLQHGQLGLRLRIVHGMAAEDVPCSENDWFIQTFSAGDS